MRPIKFFVALCLAVALTGCSEPSEIQTLRREVKELKYQVNYLRMYLADHEERLICGGLASKPKSVKVVKRQLGHMSN